MTSVLMSMFAGRGLGSKPCSTMVANIVYVRA